MLVLAFIFYIRGGNRRRGIIRDSSLISGDVKSSTLQSGSVARSVTSTVTGVVANSMARCMTSSVSGTEATVVGSIEDSRVERIVLGSGLGVGRRRDPGWEVCRLRGSREVLASEFTELLLRSL